MLNELDPIVDQWYCHRDKGESFYVVAVDNAADTVEIQNFDGDVEEFDMDAWCDLDIELAEPPEDWTGPIDDVEPDDLGYTVTEMTAKDWQTPLEPLRVDEEPWQDTRPADERDEEEEPRPIELYTEEDEAARRLAQ